MKRIDMFCASQASTAICLSMDQASCSSSNTIQLGGKAIDRHNPIISDSRRSTSKTVTAPCSSQPPINPQKAKKNSSSKPSGEENKKNAKKGHDQKKKKSVADKVTEDVTNNYYSSKPIDSILRRSWLKQSSDLITTPGSTRCLLSEIAFLDDGLSDYDPVLALNNVDNKKALVVHQDENTNPSSKPSSSSQSHSKSGSSDQVSFLSLSLSLRFEWLIYMHDL